MVTVQRLGKKHITSFKQLISLFNTVFETKPARAANDSYLQSLLSKPGFIAIAAFNKDVVIGGLTAYILPQYYGEYAEVYLYDMAVKKEYRRKGIGKKLMAALKAYCKNKKVKIIFVEAHALDKRAVAFYHSVKGKAEKVVHFNYPV